MFISIEDLKEAEEVVARASIVATGNDQAVLEQHVLFIKQVIEEIRIGNECIIEKE
jgi:hypothetical protein